MAPPRHTAAYEDLSDSDEEGRFAGVETDVLLGIPDGKVDIENDIIDAAVSRIGGLPALLPPKEPPFSSSFCKSCFQPMELLIQMWCPFENSPMDRSLYIWGCARAGCQGKDGSVRSWRGLRYNETYAAKLERKLQKKLERERQQLKADQQRAGILSTQQNSMAGAKTNPFSMAGSSPLFGNNRGHNNPFGLGAQIYSEFGASSDLSSKTPKQKPGTDAVGDLPGHSLSREVGTEANYGIQENYDEKGGCDGESDTDSDTSLLTALVSTTISDSTWKSAPSYPPLYLSTVAEYLPPDSKPKPLKGLEIDELGDENKKEEDFSWIKETYEDSLQVDQVFENFTKRVAVESGQCVRYELNGIPLPYASDKVFDLLWRKPAQEPLPVTKAEFKVVQPQRRVYDPSAVPRCPSCDSPRIFECQLMPNLINVLRPSWEGQKEKAMTQETRMKEVEKALKRAGVDKNEKKGMEWGTCIVFSCGKDCHSENDKEAKEAWKEETVYVQWDI